MSWTALIPIKAVPERKTRLAGGTTASEREWLARRMFEHVVAVLRAVPAVTDLVLLSPAAPQDWSERIIPDQGRGLNAELASAAAMLGPTPLVIVHGDLPLLDVGDVSAFLAVAQRKGSALGPDRHGLGTNALALINPVGFPFAFGPGSLQAHLAALGTRASVVRRTGLALDVDTVEDLCAARAADATSVMARADPF